MIAIGKIILKKFFGDVLNELAERKKKIKELNEALNVKKIELTNALRRVNRYIEENNRLRKENGELRNEIKKAKVDIINSKEYKTLLEKYNELITK